MTSVVGSGSALLGLQRLLTQRPARVSTRTSIDFRWCTGGARNTIAQVITALDAAQRAAEDELALNEAGWDR